MIDEFLELEKLKKAWDEIKYMLYDREAGVPFIIVPAKVLKKIKKIIREYEGW